MFSRRLFLSLILVAIPASADLLQVEISGKFDGSAPVSDISAPNVTSAITFDIDSEPTVDPFSDSFETPVSNVVYDLNGDGPVSGVNIYGDVTFYDSSKGGGAAFTVNSHAGGAGYSIDVQGDQLYSGSTSNPEFVAGPFNTSGDAYVYFDSGVSAEVRTNSIAITDLSPVPEPHTNLLLGTVLAATAFLLRRRRRLVAPREESQS
jgi:PEP-CTERM motif